MSSRKKWSVIAVSCPNMESALATQKELEIRQQRGSIPKDTFVLAVDDPKPLIGSGSATLNVLLQIAQHLCMRAGHQSVDPSIFNGLHILIMHMGRQSALSPCGSAFVTLPSQSSAESNSNLIQTEVFCNIDLLLLTLSNTVCANSPPGVWVTSCDMILSITGKTDIDWSDMFGVYVISVPTAPNYARNHGIIKIGAQGTVDDLIYRPTEEEIETCQLEDGNVPVLPVIIFLTQEISKKFLLLYTTQPLENCTFLGLDNGAQPIPISFLFDILLCMTKNITKEDFISGERSTSYGGRKNELHVNHKSTVSQFHMKNAREALWNHLSDVPLKTIFLKNARYRYLSPNGTCYTEIMRNLSTSKSSSTVTSQYFTSTKDRNKNDKMVSGISFGDEVVGINSMLNGDIDVGKNSVIINCELQGNFSIGQHTFLAGLNKQFEFADKRLIIPSKTVVRSIRLKESNQEVFGGNSEVTIAFGIEDDLTAPYTQRGSTYCNKSWNELFERTGIVPTDLWTQDPLLYPPCLLRAKLFPISQTSCGPNKLNDNILWWLVGCPDKTSNFLSQWRCSKRLSIEEIMSLVSFSQELLWRRNLFFKIGSSKVKEIVSKGYTACILPFLRSCVVEGFQNQILALLDEVANSCTSLPRLARILSHIADVLNIMTGFRGNLRSGPAKNPAWKKATDLFEKGNLVDGVKELAVQRQRWTGPALTLTRCARHYEGAVQTLIRQVVLRTKQLVEICNNPGSLDYGIGVWVVAEAPARVDLSGGWSDTPPITYEHGGIVTNVAIKLDGKRPIGAKIKKIPEFKLVLVLGSGKDPPRLTCDTLEDMRDFSNPSAPGALLKSAFLCTDTVTLSSEGSLATQLQERHGCGFELHTWSDVPKGSGLGTSSILAGVVCAAILKIMGRNYDDRTLIHLVIYLEQILTTGGGWQDQVGGLLPGVKISKCTPEIPFEVNPQRLDLSSETLTKISGHTALIYTGKTRLAKYILQDVIRRWYAGFPEILQNVDELTRNAEVCAKAWEQGDLEGMGRCLNLYRKQKKIMAPGCEPFEVLEIIKAIQSEVYGCCLAGAGGGGFLLVITKKPNIHVQLETLLKNISEENPYTVHRIEVDNQGLTIRDEKGD